MQTLSALCDPSCLTNLHCTVTGIRKLTFNLIFFSVFISQANNPLYKGATSTFTNVAYRGNWWAKGLRKNSGLHVASQEPMAESVHCHVTSYCRRDVFTAVNWCTWFTFTHGVAATTLGWDSSSSCCGTVHHLGKLLCHSNNCCFLYTHTHTHTLNVHSFTLCCLILSGASHVILKINMT